MSKTEERIKDLKETLKGGDEYYDPNCPWLVEAREEIVAELRELQEKQRRQYDRTHGNG